MLLLWNHISLLLRIFQMKKSNKEPNPMVQISVQNVTKDSKVYMSVSSLKYRRLCFSSLFLMHIVY